MRVFARFRDAGGKRDDGLVVAFPDDKTIETTHARRPDQSFTFTFDKVFEPRAPVEELFSHCVEPAAAHLAAGQHAVIYAYGHGGSGKAATLFGSKDGSEQGVLLAVLDRLHQAGQGPFAVTAVDIYKENLRDLFAPKSAERNGVALKLRDSAAAGSTVEGAAEIIVAEPAQLAGRLPALHTQAKGHCVVTVRTPAGVKLFVTKLADSDTGSTGRAEKDAETLEARKWILKSFTALGNCLKAVADRAKVVPIRESLLTRLQREALSTAAHISLVGHCSVGDTMQEETVNTLRFVHRLRRADAPAQLNGSRHGGGGGRGGGASPPRWSSSSLDLSLDPGGSGANGRVDASLEAGRGGHQRARDALGRERGAGDRERDRDKERERDGDQQSQAAAKAAQRKAALEAAVGVKPQRGAQGGGATIVPGVGGVVGGGGAGGLGASAVVPGHQQEEQARDELARAWEYAYQLENLVVWIAEVFQVGGYDPAKLADMLEACCKALNSTKAGRGGAGGLEIVQHLLSMHEEDVLALPGGQNEMVNFRRNPVDSPWVGELHQVLLKDGVLRKMENSAGVLLSSAAVPEAGKPAMGAGKGGGGGLPTLPEGASYEPPRVVSEDAKFLTLDSRIHELEHSSIGTTDALDAHIESLRKDVEDSLDHIDDELFANLVSRVSYLKMRREWALEAPPSHAPTSVASGEPDAATHDVSASSEDALRAGVEDAVALLEQTRAASQMHRTREEETQHKKKKGQVAHVRWSEHDQVREYQVPTPDKSVTEEEDEAFAAEEKEFSSASDEEVSAAKLLNLLRSSLQTHERRHQSKVYGKCFSGVQLVDWLVETMDEDKLTYVTKVWNCSVSHLASDAQMSREQACIIAQGLMNAQVFAHLGSAADFTDDETLYRFLDGEEQALVLNRQILWAATARPACTVSQDLLQQAMAIAYSGGTRDFAAVQEFQQRTSELQMVNLIQLPVEELRCFFINIFNVLILHARITSKAPTSDAHVLPRCSFFRNTSYQVGKYFYSLDDVCRGILRAKKCLFLDCDPRIHFALSYGTAATPPARLFTHENLDRELEAATRRFCSERVRVDMANNEVTLPLLFDWYRKDFSSSPAGLLEWVSPRLPASLSAQLMEISQRKEFKITFE